MPAISIPCPACGSLLKMPDNRLLGKKGRCPKCSHRFLLELPDADDVPLQLADVPVLPLAPGVGTSARWVPDELPDLHLAGEQGGAANLTGRIPSGAGKEISQSVSGASPAPAAVLDFAVPAGDESGSATEPVTRRRRRSNTGRIVMGVTFVLLLSGTCAAYFFFRGSGETLPVKKAPALDPAWEAEKLSMAESNEAAQSLSPTSGKNIPLSYLPFTPHLLCHLRPMELWKKDRSMGEFQAMLGNLGLWLREQITLRTRFEPEDIAELTFAVNFGARMSVPEIAAVVRLREPQTPTDLIKRFNGRMRPDPSVEVYDASDFSFLKIDNRTFAVAPVSMSEDLAASKEYPALASPDMEPLLRESDRDRHVTVLFDLKILDSHREDIFIEQLQKVMDKFVIRMSSQVETVSWSMHLEPNLYMETLLHNTTDSSPMKVQKHARVELSRLPEDMLWAVKQMRPTTIGSRQMIGRFPAMLQALDKGTTAHVAPSSARLVTILPKHAAANLAAGALLTWNQSLLTNFDEDTRLTSNDTTSIPDKIADRLQMQVLVDFRNTPLQEAFAYIGESIKTETAIDGKALQGAGFTQVMSQTYNLGKVSAQVAIHTILQKYAKERDPMVLIVDEAGKKLLLSTKTKAAADGLTVFDTTPKP